ncbi:MAG: T9SS type A sorting domain-containing protein [Bacteroidales bacterium]|jgi:M6 family metalloprotease-like protein|nr:T9SS type A sorting domain-containing protein [Bacteroidales bacterium]
MKKILALLLTSMFLLFGNIFAVNVENLVHYLTQPDGTVIKVFISGDEYNRRVCDENGYTITQNKNTGYWVYANVENDAFVPTSYVVGRDNPVNQCALTPNQDISPEKKRENYEKFNAVSKAHRQVLPQQCSVSGSNLRTGTLNNVTIYIDFTGEQFMHTKAQIETMFSDSTEGTSLYSYFHAASGGNFNIVSSFYPKTIGTMVYTYTAPQPRGYYQIKSTSNPIGYDENDNDLRRQREHQLLYDAVMSLKSEIEADFTAAQLDYNNDDYVDNLSFVIQDGSGDMVWSSAMFWPHRWSLYTPYYPDYQGPENNFPSLPLLNGKYVFDYFLITENHLFNIGNGHQSVLVHEMGHSLGAPDFYTGYCSTNCITPMGYWEVMASNSVPPQEAGAYVYSEYWHFIDELPTITTSGTYTVYHSWDRTPNHNTGYKIMSPLLNGEYYVIDYRRHSSGIPNTSYGGYSDDGIIITRINPNIPNGNIYGGMNGDGKDYAAYIFRPNAYDMITQGDLEQAFFSSQSGRTGFNSTTNLRPFLSDGSPDNIKISNISASGGDFMTFDVVIGGNLNLTCEPEDQCAYKFIAIDAYGDGWSSVNSTACLVVRTNGNDVYRLTAINHHLSNTETCDTFNIPLCNNEYYELWWETPSDNYWASEISFKLLDPVGNVVIAKTGESQITALPTTSSFLTVTPDCNMASEIVDKWDFVSNVLVFTNHLEVNIAAGEKIQNVELYNSLGQLVLQTVKSQFLLPNEGLYFVTIKTENAISTHKIVGKRY